MDIQNRKEVIFSLEKEIFAIQDKYLLINNFETKRNNHDIVTIADKEIEKFLVSNIIKTFPNDTIIGEEDGLSQEGDSGFTWYLDPIDGTSNYARGIRCFGTSIGLVKNEEIVFGVIFSGEDKKKYWAVKGEGAYCEEKKLSVSNYTELKNSYVDIEFPYSEEGVKGVSKVNIELVKKARKATLNGCCVISCIRIACGKQEGFWGQRHWVHVHDWCAGALLVLEAGGKVSSDDKKTILIKNFEDIFITNGLIHDEYIDFVISNYDGVWNEKS